MKNHHPYNMTFLFEHTSRRYCVVDFYIAEILKEINYSQVYQGKKYPKFVCQFGPILQSLLIVQEGDRLLES